MLLTILLTINTKDVNNQTLIKQKNELINMLFYL
jgi:hypothetical protein